MLKLIAIVTVWRIRLSRASSIVGGFDAFLSGVFPFAGWD
jgi:hypothetical protein